MKKILVGFDHTPSSQLTLGWLDDFVAFEADVILLYCPPVISIASLDDEPTIDLIEREHQRLRDAAPKVARFSFSTRVSFAAPAESLLQVADSEGVDLILVGCSQASGAARFILGSVARQVVDDAQTSVVVAKPS